MQQTCQRLASPVVTLISTGSRLGICSVDEPAGRVPFKGCCLIDKGAVQKKTLIIHCYSRCSQLLGPPSSLLKSHRGRLDVVRLNQCCRLGKSGLVEDRHFVARDRRGHRVDDAIPAASPGGAQLERSWGRMSAPGIRGLGPADVAGDGESEGVLEGVVKMAHLHRAPDGRFGDGEHVRVERMVRSLI